METAGIIVAGGRSQRFGNQDNKLFTQLHSKPVLQHSIELLDHLSWIKKIVLVGREDNIGVFKKLKNETSPSTFTDVTTGGESRFDSVQNGLSMLSRSTQYESILIQDGARPGVTNTICTRLKKTFETESQIEGVIPVLDVHDTIKRIRPTEETVKKTLDRNQLKRVQTPQLFERNALLDSVKAWEEPEPPTDDSTLLEHAGFKVKTVKGAYQARKITTPVDLKILKILMERES